MARIRTIKPEFFTNSKLYKAEKEESLPIRLAFAGLFTACDREGRFKWIPEELQLSVLPFDRDVDFSRVLHVLHTRGYIEKYRVKNEDFGFIPTWKTHQYINARESASFLPEPSESNILTREPRVDDASLLCTWGREGERKGKGKEGEGERSVREGGDEKNKTSDFQNFADHEIQTPVIFYDPVKNEKTEKEKTSAQKEKEITQPVVVDRVTESDTGKEKTAIELSHVPCRKIFLDFYLQHREIECRWNGVDGKHLNMLLGKIKAAMRKTNPDPSAMEIQDAWKIILEKLPLLSDQWYFNNLSVAIINTKFDDIIFKIKNNNGNTSSKKGQSASRAKERANHIHDLIAVLGDQGGLQEAE